MQSRIYSVYSVKKYGNMLSIYICILIFLTADSHNATRLHLLNPKREHNFEIGEN